MPLRARREDETSSLSAVASRKPVSSRPRRSRMSSFRTRRPSLAAVCFVCTAPHVRAGAVAR